MNTKDTLSVLLEKIEELKSALGDKALDSQGTTENGFLKFNDKEIFQMPKTFRKQFRAQGCTAHVRKRTDGRYNCSYEIRYAKKPYNKHPISASGTTLEEAKARFIEKLNNFTPQDDTAPVIPKNFHEFSLYWFENFHKRKVSGETYKRNFITYTHYIEPIFRNAKTGDITPTQIQSFIDGFKQTGRLAETLQSILNQILECALKHGLIKINPIGMCFFVKHERKHGTALTKHEEKRLLDFYDGTPFQIDFAIALYTGLRPNEFKTAVMEGDFIKAKNSKRKGGKTESKKIPISPMLKAYLSESGEIHMHSADAITNKLKAVFPNHMLYDLRTTFQTRCTECGISDVAIGLFMGNAIGGELKKAYTDVSDEWLLQEGEKLKY